MIPIMNYQYLLIGTATLSVLLTFALVWVALRVRKIDKIRKDFFLTDNQMKIDDAVVEHHEGIKQLNEQLVELGQYTAGLAQANKKNFQKIGFIRYNPFNDAGGAISFVVAILDAEDNGVVISSLHGREGNRIYAKEVSAGISKSQLTEEEQEAIKKAA
jgi:hypothetical protein